MMNQDISLGAAKGLHVFSQITLYMYENVVNPIHTGGFVSRFCPWQMF